MQKIIKNIIAMNDSSKLNEKEMAEKNLGQTQDVSADDGKKTVIGKVKSITDSEVLVDFVDKEEGVLPLDKFTEVSVGDTVEATLENKDGKLVITEVTVVAEPKEENASEEKTEDKNLRAKIRGYNFTTDVVDVEVLATQETLSFKLGNFFPTVEFGKAIDIRTQFNIDVEETDGIRKVKAVQIAAEESKAETNKESTSLEKMLKDADLSYIDPEFLLDCMSVPTHSKLEYRMVAYIIMWARRNNIKYEFDEFGNVYLTKGELDEGEFYPCVTSHLDTVQSKHDPYIYAGVPLELNVSEVVNQGVTEHKVSVNNEGGSEIGIGADDKGGICICLSMFEHIDKLKACFFLDEETGCHGSDNLDEDWFKDVGYVIGFDSPDLYRAAWACDGTQLFNYDFYTKYMKSVCDSWGLVKGCFFSEPYTDVKNIREKIEVICMNFGNGGYNAHNIGGTEYCIMEHMDQACGMGIDLVEKIGNTRHMLEHKGRYSAANPTVIKNDILPLEELGDSSRKGYRPTGSTSTNSSTNSNSNGSSNITNKPTVSKDDEIKFETVKYITDKYEALIDNIKGDVLETVKTLCESNNIDFSIFEKSITDNFSNEIKF